MTCEIFALFLPGLAADRVIPAVQWRPWSFAGHQLSAKPLSGTVTPKP